MGVFQPNTRLLSSSVTRPILSDAHNYKKLPLRKQPSIKKVMMPHFKVPNTPNASGYVPNSSNHAPLAHSACGQSPYLPFCQVPWPCCNCGHSYQLPPTEGPVSAFQPYQAPPAYADAAPPHTTSGASLVTTSTVGASKNDIIFDVSNRDILCGRGAPTSQHPGNQFFREVVSQFQLQYTAARRAEKPEIALRVVRIIEKNGGRFLKRNKFCSRDGHFGWEEVGAQRAYEKACQALREGAPEMRRHLEAQEFDSISIDGSIDCDSVISDL